MNQRDRYWFPSTLILTNDVNTSEMNGYVMLATRVLTTGLTRLLHSHLKRFTFDLHHFTNEIDVTVLIQRMFGKHCSPHKIQL
jgi:hypothetical protein